MDLSPHNTHPDRPAGHSAPRHGKRRGKQRDADGPPQLNLTSMIDVIFMLLIYFVITADFQVDEGTILATLPGNSDTDRVIDTPPTPVMIELASADDGVSYALRVDGRALDGVSALHGYLDGAVKGGRLAKDDLIEIRPQGVVRWQHVVNVFNACVRAEMTEVGFAP